MSDLVAQIEASARRFRELIDGVRDEQALGALAPDWTAGEIVRHVTFLPGYYASILAGNAHLAPTATEMATTNIENLSTLTDLTIAECAEQFTAGMATLCHRFGEAAGGDAVPFHAGAGATPEQLAAICIGELEIHGLDLADAIHARWKVDERAAAMTVLGAVPAAGAAWLDRDRAAKHNGRYTIRLRDGHGALMLTFSDGDLEATATSSESALPASTMVSARADALLMVLYRRRSQWRAIALGQMISYGRTPWRALSLTSKFLTI